ncbi:MAG: alanine--tRNA ligase [Gammaproteobacteria bacterium]
MKTIEIRQKFLDYFESKSHKVCPSSSLIPTNDETLLFTNAGMVQFKDVFLGTEKSSFVRATSAQKCIRAGGKHNDLENVGYTLRHHTFFEMLGNFSFGDYFKEDAIKFAWDFLTKELKLNKDKLWISVFKEDLEAEEIWKNLIGIDPKRIARLDEKDNFWSMGDTGPCGPCSEIYYDHGEEFDGTPPGHPGDEGDRFVEIWNLVFMQFNRDQEGKLTPLPKPSVDTGMGLERIAAVMQKVASNYSIDLFKDLISASEGLLKNAGSNSHKVIADHIRSASFLVSDGIVPSNEGRGYVLRRIIRRAVRHGYKLGAREPFFYKLVTPLVETMGSQYLELKSKAEKIKQILQTEEIKFFETLGKGLKILDEHLSSKKKIISGEIAFKLHDTFGFPIDLTQDIAREKEIKVDIPSFYKLMEKQQESSKQGSSFTKLTLDLGNLPETIFDGYHALQSESSVLGIWEDGKAIEKTSGKRIALVAFKNTPFYGESGGQVGDKGEVSSTGFLGKILDCQKEGGIYLHSVQSSQGSLSLGENVKLIVSDKLRNNAARNHSATHLLHAALKQVLGNHIEQKGSLVNDQKLRFDFSHPKPLTKSEIRLIEDLVNTIILQNDEANTKLMKLNEAKAAGAEAMFGEKYSDEVRVLTLGAGFSMELCGGTHVERSGDIGLFLIQSESSASSGIRRLEAITGENALGYIRSLRENIHRLQTTLNTPLEDISDKVKKLQEENKSLKKGFSQTAAINLQETSFTHKDIILCLASSSEKDTSSLRGWVDNKKANPKTIAVCFGGSPDNLLIIVGVSKDLKKNIQANTILNSILQPFKGRGGGKEEFAQGTLTIESTEGLLETLLKIIKEII